MRPTPFRRYYTGIAVLAMLGVLAISLASTPAIPAVEASSPIEPRFFDWEGTPFSDGLSHFLITVAPATIDEKSWLRIDDDDFLVATDQPGASVDPAQLDALGIESDSTPASVEELAGAIALLSGVDRIEPLGFDIYAVAGTITTTDLAAQPGVTSVAEDSALTEATVDPYYPTQWGLDNDGISTDPWAVADDADVDAPEAWHRTRGDGVVVAVIDSGVDITHPDLVNNIWHNPGEQCGNGIDDDANGYIDDCTGWDFANGTSVVTDYVGHGTHVAGIIAAEADNGVGVAGLAYEAEIMPLKMGDAAPALSAGIEAIAYAIDNGARVINASWGISDPAAAGFLETAIAAAADAGVLVVTAAGNQPVDIDTTPTYPGSLALDNIITVGASTAMDTPAPWSSYGSTSVDVYAPGEYIISTVPGGYDIYSGTSMAAPMVSAAAALLWSATPQANYQEVKGALLDRSDGPNDGVTAFRNLSVSEGRLNVDRAIYSAPLFQPPIMYEFWDFNSFAPGLLHDVTITAKTVDPWKAPPQTAAMYRAGLYVPYEGEPMAVVGHEITFTDSSGAAITIATDQTGRALVGEVFEPEERSTLVQDGDPTQLQLSLPAGTYAFVMELVDVTDPDDPVTMADPSAVFFIVSADGSITEMPQIPIGGTPYPTTTTSVPTVTSPPATSPTTTIAAPGTTVPSVSTTSPAPTTTVAVTTTQPAPSETTTTTVAVPTTGAPATTTTPPTTVAANPSTTIAPSPTTTTGGATTTTGALPATTTEAPNPTTTTPVTTSPPTTVPSDRMIVSGINPAEGPASGHTLATISGSNLPASPTVYFGERAVEVVTVVAGTFIVVDTPPGEAGWVDVRVVDRATGDEATLVNGYLYLDNEQPPPPSTLPPTTTSPPSPTTVAVTSTTATTATTAPTTSMPATTTTAPTVAPSPSLEDWRDSLLQTPEGLTLAPVPEDSPIAAIPLDVWVGALCVEPMCPGWVLEQ